MPGAKAQTEGRPPAKVMAAASKSGDGEGGDAESKKGVGFMELIKYHVD